MCVCGGGKVGGWWGGLEFRELPILLYIENEKYACDSGLYINVGFSYLSMFSMFVLFNDIWARAISHASKKANYGLAVGWRRAP